MGESKICRTCNVEKRADEFPPQRRVCSDCVRKQARERMQFLRELDPEAQREAVRRHRRDNPDRVYAWNQKKQLAAFGLTWETYLAMIEAQGGRCAICQRTKPGGKGRWHVDHDHRCCGKKKACGKCRRGLLCFNCNVALGYLNDDPSSLEAALGYLRTYQRE